MDAQWAKFGTLSRRRGDGRAGISRITFSWEVGFTPR